TGVDQRWTEAGGAYSGEPDGAGELWAEPGRYSLVAGHGQRGPGEGNPERIEAGVYHRGERPTALEQRLQQGDYRLPEWEPSAALRYCQRCRQRGERVSSGLDGHLGAAGDEGPARATADPDSGSDCQHSAAAGREHHRRRE